VVKLSLLLLFLAQGNAPSSSKSSPSANPPKQPQENTAAANPDPNAAQPVVQPQATPPQPSAEDQQSSNSPKLETTKTAVPIAQSPPPPDERIADYTRWLTWFTGVLAVGTLGLLIVAVRQGNQSEREFVSTHRPRLVVRSVSIERQAKPDGRPGYAAVMHYSIRYLVVNVGETAATIIRSSTTRYFLPTPKPWLIDDDNPYGSDLQESAPITLASGESWTGISDGEELQKGLGQGYTMMLSFPVYFLGNIMYEDRGKTKRQSGFIRRLNPRDFELLREVNPDYEYAD
jgi:hypothetical protein